MLVVAFAISLPAVTPRIYASDEIQYFSYLRSLWFDRDVSFENEYQYFFDRNIGRGEGFHATFLEQYTEAGRRPSFATIGSAILWAPFYLAGDLVARVSGAERDGLSYPYVAAVAYGSAFYGFVAILLSIAAARRVVGDGLLAGVLVWIGTPLLLLARVLGVRRCALCHRLAASARGVDGWRRGCAGTVRGADGDGARAGCRLGGWPSR